MHELGTAPPGRDPRDKNRLRTAPKFALILPLPSLVFIASGAKAPWVCPALGWKGPRAPGQGHRAVQVAAIRISVQHEGHRQNSAHGIHKGLGRDALRAAIFCTFVGFSHRHTNSSSQRFWGGLVSPLCVQKGKLRHIKGQRFAGGEKTTCLGLWSVLKQISVHGQAMCFFPRLLLQWSPIYACGPLHHGMNWFKKHQEVGGRPQPLQQLREWKGFAKAAPKVPTPSSKHQGGELSTSRTDRAKVSSRCSTGCSPQRPDHRKKQTRQCIETPTEIKASRCSSDREKPPAQSCILSKEAKSRRGGETEAQSGEAAHPRAGH